MGKILTILSLSFALLLFPPAVLAIISQNAIPGDSTYPIKRKLEDGIILIASVSPVTKTWFSMERSNRRFKEAAVLLSQGNSASTTLTELVDQTAVAAEQISEVQDVSKKQELINQLSESIKQYDQGLSKAASSQTPTPVSTPTPIVPLSPVPSATPGTAFSRSSLTSNPSQMAVSTETIPVVVSPPPSPAAAPLPVASVAPSIIPTPVPPNPQPVIPSVATKSNEIEKTRQDLDKVAKFLDEENDKLKQRNKDATNKNTGNKDNKERSQEKKDGDDKKSDENSKGRKN